MLFVDIKQGLTELSQNLANDRAALYEREADKDARMEELYAAQAVPQTQQELVDAQGLADPFGGPPLGDPVAPVPDPQNIPEMYPKHSFMAAVTDVFSETPEVNVNFSTVTDPSRSLDPIPLTKQPQAIRDLWDRLGDAETGNLKGAGKYIRTKYVVPGGSSAYGPAQINGPLMAGARSQLDLTKEEDEYVDKFLKQAYNFVTYGRNPHYPDSMHNQRMKGYELKYDYGGAGDLAGKEDRKLYESVALKLIALIKQQAGGDMYKFANYWRFGQTKVDAGQNDLRRDDPRWLDRFGLYDPVMVDPNLAP